MGGLRWQLGASPISSDVKVFSLPKGSGARAALRLGIEKAAD